MWNLSVIFYELPDVGKRARTLGSSAMSEYLSLEECIQFEGRPRRFRQSHHGELQYRPSYDAV